MPPPAVRRMLLPDATAQLQPIPYACGAQRTLLPIAVGAMNINDVRESSTIFPHPCKLTLDLLNLTVVAESRVMIWATCVSILDFLGLSVLELFRCTRQTSDKSIA